MGNTLIATIGGLSALIGWGVSDYLVAKSSRKNNGFEVNAAVQVFALVAFLPVIFIAHPHVHHWNNIAVGALSEVLFLTAYLCLIKAFSLGAIGVVAPIANAYPFFTLVLTLIFLTTSFPGLQIFAMILVVLGAIMLGFESGKKGYGFHGKPVVYAGATAVIWGVAFFVLNTVVAKESWQTMQATLGITSAIVASGLMLIFSRDRLQALRRLPRNTTGLWSGVTLGLGSIMFFVGSNRAGSVLIPAVIGAACPLVTSLLANLVDGEKLGIIKRIGAVVVVLGIVLINAA